MKKYIIMFAVFFFVSLAGYAQVVPKNVYAITPYNLSASNLDKDEEIELIALDAYKLTDNIQLHHGQIIKVKLNEYVNPTRGKRNGYYKIAVTNVEGIESNNLKNISGKMRVSSPKDFKSIAKSAGVCITGHILKVPGFSQALAVSKGLLKPDADTGRLKSAGKNLYESTPLTYIEKGADFEVSKDGIVVLKLKSADNE